MKQTERLKLIYLQLQAMPQTIASLKTYLAESGVTISNRQLYRDLQDVEKLLLRPGEILEQRIQEYNRKVWAISSKQGAAYVTNYDIDTYLISRATVPLGISIGRKQSLKKIFGFLNDSLANSKFEQNNNWAYESLKSTHFYEVPFDEAYQQTLDQVLWATTNQRTLLIESYSGDSVSLNKSISFPLSYNPVQIIYHRGSFFVAGITAALPQPLVLDINQITKYTLSNSVFRYKKVSQQVNEELKKRFGITQNINEQVYHIALEFSPVTGQFVRNHLWHHSQTFQQLPNGNYVMHMQCGINRELVGWIFQWMGNVKILAPDLLLQYYQEQLNIMLQNQQGNNLGYTNIFQPV